LGAEIEAGLWYRGGCLRIEQCEKCGGKVKIISCTEDPEVVEKILKLLGLDEASQARNR
jgi:hypothetical protein